VRNPGSTLELFSSVANQAGLNSRYDDVKESGVS